MPAFPSTVEIHLRWRDIDELGHLTHSVYHDFLAEGRVDVMGAGADAEDFRFVLARVEMDYRHEVRHGEGHVTIHSGIERVGGSSVTIAQELRLPDGTVAAEARTVMVAWDGDARVSRTLTDPERTAFEAVMSG